MYAIAGIGLTLQPDTIPPTPMSENQSPWVMVVARWVRKELDAADVDGLDSRRRAILSTLIAVQLVANRRLHSTLCRIPGMYEGPGYPHLLAQLSQTYRTARTRALAA